MKYGYYFYKPAIEYIIQDLKLQYPISWSFRYTGKYSAGSHVYYFYRKHVISIGNHASWLVLQTLDTIAHELRHAYQWETKMLKMAKGEENTTSIWQNTRYSRLNIKDDDYDNLPWEIDAREYASTIVNTKGAMLARMCLKMPAK